MSEQKQLSENSSLLNILSTALACPGIKISRDDFLRETFSHFDESLRKKVIEEGPVAAGYQKETLRRIAKNIIQRETYRSSGVSFITGLPGGPIALTAGIAADTIQFFGVALRLAQELSYLYGAEDLWNDNTLDRTAITNHFVIYCGVMFGVSGASATMRVAFAALGKQALKKLPQKALTKSWYFAITKAIVKVFGIRLTKSTFAKGISKALPIVGGLVSGGITYISMPPMGNRLVDALEEVQFDYSDEKFAADIEAMKKTAEAEQTSGSSAIIIESDSEESSNDTGDSSAAKQP